MVAQLYMTQHGLKYVLNLHKIETNISRTDRIDLLTGFLNVKSREEGQGGVCHGLYTWLN